MTSLPMVDDGNAEALAALEAFDNYRLSRLPGENKYYQTTMNHFRGNHADMTDEACLVCEREYEQGERFACGHKRFTSGCGGCDPSSCEFVMEDAHPGVLRAPRADDFSFSANVLNPYLLPSHV